MRKYLSLSGLALIAACGGSSPRNDDDSDSDRKVDLGQRDTRDMYNCPPDSGKNQEDMYNAEKCDSGTDGSSSRDMGSDLEGRIDMGREDMETPDICMDMGLPDEGVTYPIARLNCSERNDEGLCVYRLILNERYCWDASPSEAALCRELVNYRFWFGIPGLPGGEDISITNDTPDLCGFYDLTSEDYGFPDGFHAELEVTDNFGDSARVGMRNIVRRID